MSNEKELFAKIPNGIKYLNKENAVFEMSENGFLFVTADGEKSRAVLHRAFPYDMPDEYISVLNEKNEEKGMIRALADFDDVTREILSAELERKYFYFHIKKIKTLKDNRGFTYWTCDTDCGEVTFTVQDTFRSITKISDDKIMIQDVDGCRYGIDSLEALDKKSMRKIELYL